MPRSRSVGKKKKSPRGGLICSVMSVQPPRSWLLEFQNYPPSQNARLHWRTRASSNKLWRSESARLCRDGGIPPLGRVRIDVVVLRRALGVADEGNDRDRMKPIVDGIVDARVIDSDVYGRIEWGFMSEDRGVAGLRVTITEVV